MSLFKHFAATYKRLSDSDSDSDGSAKVSCLKHKLQFAFSKNDTAS